MDNQTITTLVTVFLIPVAGALATFIVKWLNAKAENLKALTNNERVNYYIDILNNTIHDVVVSLNASTVDDLKEAAADGRLTPEEIKVIQSTAIKKVVDILGPTGIQVLGQAFDDLEVMIAAKIDMWVERVKDGV